MVRLHHARIESGTRRLGRGRLRSRPGRTCASCGCALASDNGGKLCGPCRHRPRYDPRTDSEFPKRLARYLFANVGRECSPCAHFAVIPAGRLHVWRCIERLRGEGWVIHGLKPPQGGYRVETTPWLDCGSL